MIEKYNILVSSVGGQGGVTLARIISQAAMLQGYNVLVGETLGMAQRGGAVQSHIRIGNKVHGFVIPNGETDILLSLEPSESVRTPELIGPETKVIMSTHFVNPIQTILGKQNACDLSSIIAALKKITPKVYALDARQIALSVEAPNSLNIVILGAYAALNEGVLSDETLKEVISITTPKRFLKDNTIAFKIGYKEMLSIIHD
jgi:indolepyruvate ferredoxin oxidoreductase beta subunit